MTNKEDDRPADYLKHFFEIAEQELKLPINVISNLGDEDDWSFVIKLCAIAERSLNHVTTKALSETGIIDLIQSQGIEKKIHLAVKMKILDKGDSERLKFLVTLRNMAAHHIEFSLDSSLSNQDIKNRYIQQFTEVWVPDLMIKGKKIDLKKFILENSRITLFHATIAALSMSHLETEIQRLSADAELFSKFIGTFSKNQGMLRK